ncbi:hypothetical protein, partial [Klebsiella pneumoniae]|uniref:hypothetical protein n=1 Tax=Klebsiella pneumoniae TaxID=573 RepID=UPI001B3C1604
MSAPEIPHTSGKRGHTAPPRPVNTGVVWPRLHPQSYLPVKIKLKKTVPEKKFKKKKKIKKKKKK